MDPICAECGEDLPLLVEDEFCSEACKQAFQEFVDSMVPTFEFTAKIRVMADTEEEAGEIATAALDYLNEEYKTDLGKTVEGWVEDGQGVKLDPEDL